MSEVSIAAGEVELAGELTMPERMRGVVMLLGCGESRRFSPRSVATAKRFQDAGFGTLLIDFVTPAEDAADRNGQGSKFDLEKLSGRAVAATEWLQRVAQSAGCGVGYFAMGRATPVALRAAAHHPDHVSAVVCAGGRPDLAMETLPKIRAATLLIVGALDRRSAESHRRALAYLRCERHLESIAGASQRFAERGALEQVAELATSWLLVHVPAFATALA
ncbi:MAG TPA: hypothetical protein VLV78_17500 [Thermoanaerobaculia bacterium]|nr:hypothetical protein [Thermoanaerobaculia bacterium]